MLSTLILLAAAAAACAAAPGQTHTNRSEALQALCQKLGVGLGAVVADVGCGDGPDTMVFASVVGPKGVVFAQEIEAAKLSNVVKNTEKRSFSQVTPVLGHSEDPRLPDGSADLIYMNRVFHHFSRPAAMLERMRSDLKPGGFLAIVDQEKGPLTDWTPVDKREKQHHWTAETAVVRLAREAGFLFHDEPDELWHEKQPFVLVFRKPVQPARTAGDPDRPRDLDVTRLVEALPLAAARDRAVVFVGLDAGRPVLPALRAALPASARLIDVTLEEWALSREETPAGGSIPGVEPARKEKNELALPADTRVELALFVDAYHRVWDPAPVLKALRARLTDTGLVAVVDRKGPHPEARRLANHRRRVAPQQVEADLRQAGFEPRGAVRAPARDRFFLLFGPGRGQ